MSRQRLRAGMVEGATIPCPHCEGRGVIRSVGSMALRVLRAVEEYCQREKMQAITLRVSPEIALYILNHKRAQLTAIEDRRGVYIFIEAKTSLAASAYEIERGASVPFEPRKAVAASAVTVESEMEANDDVHEVTDDDGPAEVTVVEDDREESERPARAARDDQDDGKRRKRRRRRGGRDRGDRERGPAPGQPPGVGPQPDAPFADDRPLAAADAGSDADDDDDGDAEGDANGNLEAGQQPAAVGENGEGLRRKRRRGRRGRRGRRPDEGGGVPYQGAQGGAPASPLGHLPTPAQALDAPDWPATGGFDTTPGAAPRTYDAPRPRREPAVAPREAVYSDAPKADAPRAEEPKAERSSIASFFGFGANKPEEGDEGGSDSKPQRKGWWQRKPDA
jgi:ribonuclease E